MSVKSAATLADLLEKDIVPFSTLRERYGALLELVHTLIGVVPLLSRLHHERVIRDLATMIRDNFMKTVIGKDKKLGAGLIYAEAVKSKELTKALQDAGAKPPDDSPENKTVKLLGEALAPSPTTVNEHVISACKELAPQAIVEVVTFIALLQVLHRIETYYPA